MEIRRAATTDKQVPQQITVIQEKTQPKHLHNQHHIIINPFNRLQRPYVPHEQQPINRLKQTQNHLLPIHPQHKTLEDSSFRGDNE